MIFPLISWMAIYFIVWWMTLFAVLPFHARSQAEEGVVVRGSDPGAPARLKLGRVLLTTTLAATAVFALVAWVLTQKQFGLDDVPFLPRYHGT